ncbi:MAG: LPS export ABC transporter periplasmic protein LptC [bacterium]
MRKQLLIALIIIAIIVMTGCGSEKKMKPNLPVGDKIENIPNYVIEGFKLMSTDKGKQEWEIEGKNAQVFEMKKRIFVQNFSMKTFEKNGSYSMTTGKRAIINTDNNFMEVSENVIYTASNGMVLKTEKLFWDNTLKKIYTDEKVMIIKGQSVLKGIGFESDASMQNMKIKRHVRLTAKDMQDAGIQ